MYCFDIILDKMLVKDVVLILGFAFMDWRRVMISDRCDSVKSLADRGCLALLISNLFARMFR